MSTRSQVSAESPGGAAEEAALGHRGSQAQRGADGAHGAHDGGMGCEGSLAIGRSAGPKNRLGTISV